jgi:hypothetical protein
MQDNQTLTFALLDDLMLAVSSARQEASRVVMSRVTSSQLGPFLEYRTMQTLGFPVPIPYEELRIKEFVAAYDHMARPNDSDELSLAPLKTEFVKCPTNNHEYQAASWIAFCKRMQNAAQAAGFEKSFSAGIVGGFQEMADNVLLHSELPQSGIAAYRWESGQFEFAVADHGVGVLNSLRKSSVHAELSDHGEAIRLATTKGASRFGFASGHGHGFRTLFARLVAHGGEIRFRSGDHALALVGVLEGTRAQLLQRPLVRGFLVSVRCFL